MTITLMLGACLLSAAAAWFVREERARRLIAVAGSTVVAALAVVASVPVMFGTTMDAGSWYLDGFGALLVLLVGLIQWTATLVSLGYLREEERAGLITSVHVRAYYALLPLFVWTMLLTLVAKNVGILWAALEGTTLATVLLVAFYAREGSLEAAWKYLLLCSVGISLGLLGVLLAAAAAVSTGLDTGQALDWTVLREHAATFPPSLMRWAFAFIMVGFGTKVGLAPMHAWLPDAHGRTPSPVSALLSGVLLNVALFAILRFKTLTDLALGGDAWTNRLLLVFGALSFALPAAFLLVQRNYKRLLAYSSIEHMGFIVLALGLGPAGRAAALVHLVGHALLKSALFYGTGNILLRFHTTKIDKVSRAATFLPYTGTLFFLGLLALLATPPSPLFMSEYAAFAVLVTAHPILAIVLLIAGTVIVAGMVRQVMDLLYARRQEAEPAEAPPERWGATHSIMTAHLAAALVLGVAAWQPQVLAWFAAL